VISFFYQPQDLVRAGQEILTANAHRLRSAAYAHAADGDMDTCRRQLAMAEAVDRYTQAHTADPASMDPARAAVIADLARVGGAVYDFPHDRTESPHYSAALDAAAADGHLVHVTDDGPVPYFTLPQLPTAGDTAAVENAPPPAQQADDDTDGM